MLITAADVQRLRDLNFPVDLVLAGAQPCPVLTGPAPDFEFHNPGCPAAHTPLDFAAAGPVYLLCTRCESHDPIKPPFAVLHDALYEVNVITQLLASIRQELQYKPSPWRHGPPAALVVNAMLALAGVPTAHINPRGDYPLPLEAFIDSLAALVNGVRDEYRAWLLPSVTAFDPEGPERYLLLRDVSPSASTFWLSTVAAFPTVAQAGRWTVIQAPDLTVTPLFERDALNSNVADLGPVGDGLPPAAWAAFTAASPQAGTTLAEQCELVNALRAACTH